MPEAGAYPYETRLNILYTPLELIDVRHLADACTYRWYNQTLCQVNDSVVRLGVVQGEYHWHAHAGEDEFFYVVEGRFLIDLEDRTVDLLPGQGVRPMIVRAWRGFAAPNNAEEYPRYLLQAVRPKLQNLTGFRGLYLLRRRAPAEIEYQVLTLWDSMEAVRTFAGATPERAVVEPEARAALLRFDAEVHHYEVLAEPGAPS